MASLKTLLRTSSSCSPRNLLLSSRSFSNRVSASVPKKTIPESESESESEAAAADINIIPTSGISRPLSEILKELNRKVPDSFIRTRMEDGFSIKYVPWHIVNRIMNLHAPEWSGEVRSVTYSADGKSVSVVYRVTLYGTDAEIYRESTGTASVEDTNFGDPVQKAEAMAFRRACARLGLGLHLYHEDMV
ncbi:cobalt ion binding protein isoform X2 [Tasmannia lanceolata]|uniref:cobalt ion binding protein isoform X2 n=1 Tax=Tasmannia lanceolata TaxID=3420 RepID=UPI004062E0F3